MGEAQTVEKTTDQVLQDLTTPREAAPLARIPELVTGAPERAAPANIAAAALRAEAQTFSCSPEIDQLAAGLAQAQLAFGAIEKSLTAKVESRREGARSYQYDYAPLSEVLGAVRPALNSNGIAIMQPPGLGTKTVVITTLLLHVSGQWFRSDLRFPFSLEHIDPQALGTVISYLRRYCVMSILGVSPEESEDDDAAKFTQQIRNGNGNGQKPATTVPMPQRASAQDVGAPITYARAAAQSAPPPTPAGFLLTACTKKTSPRGDYWSATWRGKDVVAFGEIGEALEKAFRANRLLKDLVTHNKPASVGSTVFVHVDEIVFAGGAS